MTKTSLYRTHKHYGHSAELTEDGVWCECEGWLLRTSEHDD